VTLTFTATIPILTVKLLIFPYTVNDKSFEGEKFCGLLGSSDTRGKVLRFFPLPPSYIHGFPTPQNIYEYFNKSFAFLMWTLLKTALAYSEMDKSTLLTRVSRFHAFWARMTMALSQEEKSYSWSESEMKQIRVPVLTTSLLASSASYSWQKPSRFFATTVEYFLKIFHSVNFQRSKSLAGKTFAVY